MDDMDELLSQLKAEYGQSKNQPEKSNPQPSSSVQKSPSTPTNNSPPQFIQQTSDAGNSGDSLDRLLADVKQELESGVSPHKINNSPQSAKSVGTNSSPQNDRLLRELEQEQQEQELIAQQQHQAELAAAQQREQQRIRKRQVALIKEAEQWLEKLNPRSSEGRWFAEFATSYESRLQAAIDYLQAMDETGL